MGRGLGRSFKGGGSFDPWVSVVVGGNGVFVDRHLCIFMISMYHCIDKVMFWKMGHTSRFLATSLLEAHQDQ